MGKVVQKNFVLRTRNRRLHRARRGIVLPKSPRVSSPTATLPRHWYGYVYPLVSLISGAHLANYMLIYLSGLHL
ncbi:hypothetical protein HanRHA438_Chr06g0266991 [Helianthus annuus]|nr:hypothetical protein HanRHA438_Chr06g0266991 [Helianthus annuus]